MNLTKTQSIIASAAGAIVIGAAMFGGGLWAMEQHFETIEAHEASLELASNNFAKALNDNARIEVEREIRRLEYRKQKGIITDQELYELQGLYQDLEKLK